MGLRTASVRHPNLEVMAPALTETTQAQTFKLPPKDHSIKYGTFCKNVATATAAAAASEDDNQDYLDAAKLDDAVSNLNTLALVSESLLTASANTVNIMGDSPLDMGLQKTNLDSLKCHNNEKNNKEQDVEQLLINNLSSELPQNVDDLMQVIKSIANDPNDEEEVFPVNNLTSFLSDVDMNDMNISIEDQQDKEAKSKDLIVELKTRQTKLERRLDFLKRRIRKLQARDMGQHVSDEISGVFEAVNRTLKRSTTSAITTSATSSTASNNVLDQPSTSSGPPPVPPLLPPPPPAPLTSQETILNKISSTKSLLKKLEMTAAMQATSSSKQKQTIRYFGSGSVDTTNFNGCTGVVTPWPLEQKQELQKVAGALHTELKLVQQDFDSEATESSSGGESCDEFQNYNNPHQQYLSIQKRALWKYLASRAAIAARWTWLQAQISDLEYRIRQHSDLHKQIRSTKGPVQLGGEEPPPSFPLSPTAVNGYRGQLPGNSSTIKNDNSCLSNTTTTTTTTTTTVTPNSNNSDATTTDNNNINEVYDYQCARTRPLVNFKKRKLLQTAGLHIVSKKASRPSTIRCGCVGPSVTCPVCTGRTDPTFPRDPSEALSKAERIALVDPSFHPVFSLPEDISCGVHCDAIMKVPEWQQRSTRMKSIKLTKSERTEKQLIEARPKKIDGRKKYGRLLKPSTVSALSAKIKNKMRNRKLSRSSTEFTGGIRKRSISKGGSLQQQYGEDEEVESIGNGNNNNNNTNNNNVGNSTLSPSSSPLLHMQAITGYNKKNRSNSYDIDNIVIPYSVAASTRVEKLQYKEILTPKWRIAEIDYNCDNKNNGIVKNPSQENSDAEDLSEESVITRHDKCEYEEKKKFLSYLKLPLGYGRARSHKRTDSLAESSGANTPDPMSPHPVEHQESHNSNNTNTSPITSPPATPHPDENNEKQPPSTVSSSANRRRTISQSRYVKDNRETDNTMLDNIIDIIPPYEARLFPLKDDVYEKMLENMPENHQFQTNIRAQDSYDDNTTVTNYFDERSVDSPGTESTESAVGDEDPNDPEWIDMETTRDRHKR